MKLNNENPVASLPKIVRYLYMSDAGPSDGRGSDICPHCGSDGRYVHYFVCDDGTTRGAMSGCIKLFPVSEIAQVDMALSEKEREYKTKGWKLNSWQTKMREAINAHYNGELALEDALRIIQAQKASQAAWRSKKYGRR